MIAHSILYCQVGYRRTVALWPYGSLVVTSRRLEDDAGVWEVSVWRDGAKVREHRDGPGEWRKIRPVS